MNYYERHIGDYLKDTAHLSLLEHGIYTRLLDVYYTRERGFRADEVARLVGARTPEERTALEAVLDEFFILNAEDVYEQTRCAREITRFKGKQAQAQRAAAASVASRQASAERPLNARSAPVEPTLNVPSNQTPVTIPKDQERERGKPRPARKAPEDFVVTPEMRRWASENAAGVSVEEQTARFLDHTFATSCIDWPGRWRNWMRKAPEFGKPTETAYQASMRQRAAEMHPAIARKAPGIAQNPMEILDGLTVARIAR